MQRERERDFIPKFARPLHSSDISIFLCVLSTSSETEGWPQTENVSVNHPRGPRGKFATRGNACVRSLCVADGASHVSLRWIISGESGWETNARVTVLVFRHRGRNCVDIMRALGRVTRNCSATFRRWIKHALIKCRYARYHRKDTTASSRVPFE